MIGKAIETDQTYPNYAYSFFIDPSIRGRRGGQGRVFERPKVGPYEGSRSAHEFGFEPSSSRYSREAAIPCGMTQNH